METNKATETARARLAEAIESSCEPRRKAAARLDIDPATLSRILSGERNPTPAQAVAIAREYRIAGRHWGFSPSVLRKAAEQ